MQAKIHLSGATVKQLEHFLRVAFRCGNLATTHDLTNNVTIV